MILKNSNKSDYESCFIRQRTDSHNLKELRIFTFPTGHKGWNISHVTTIAGKKELILLRRKDNNLVV
jgi:hypothetical protein